MIGQPDVSPGSPPLPNGAVLSAWGGKRGGGRVALDEHLGALGGPQHRHGPSAWPRVLKL